MKMVPINLLILFGGRSCEHAVSVISATSLLQAINPDKYAIQLLGITEKGQWRWSDSHDIQNLLHDGIVDENKGLAVTPNLNSTGQLISINDKTVLPTNFDIIFPMLHGPMGEDGTIQGLFELMNIPYVGCGVLASACGMDKIQSKVLFAQAGLKQADYIKVAINEWTQSPQKKCKQINQRLHYPLFVKPSNMGSSVGVKKVTEPQFLIEAIEHALQFDTHVLVENGFENVMEVECAVLGNDRPIASIVGKICPGADFYDYDSKYIDNCASVTIPAPINDKLMAKAQDIALKAFKAIHASGLARVDLFVDNTNENIWVNEINTLPGFTPISMYPKLMQASDLPYDELIDKLVTFAIERHAQKNALKSSYSN